MKNICSFFIAFVSVLTLMNCEKAVELDKFSSPFDNISITARDTIIDTLVYSGKVSYKQIAYKLSINDPSGLPVSTSEPVIFNVYRYVDSDSGSAPVRTLIARIFRGSNGFSETGVSKIVYKNDAGLLDTLLYRGSLDTLFVTGAHNKEKFRFAVAALVSLKKESGLLNVFSGGVERFMYINPAVNGGVIRSYLELLSPDGNKEHTADSRVTLKTRLNLKGIDTLYILKLSSYGEQISFASLWALDSTLRVNRNLQGTVKIDANYKLRLSDSIIINSGMAEVGRFDGIRKVSTTYSALSGYFNKKCDSISVDSAFGESDWYDLTGEIQLTGGVGTKYLYLYNPLWPVPYLSSIKIRSYTWEFALRPSTLDSVYETALGYLVAGDRIPFVLNTFGDTTFGTEAEVWLLTKNLTSSVLASADQASGTFSFGTPYFSAIEAQGMSRFSYEWPELLLETVPQKFRMKRGSGVSDVLTPDYENGYRVSPFWYYSAMLNIDSTLDTVLGTSSKVYYSEENTTLNVQTVSVLNMNSSDASLRVKPGSVLGYSDKFIDNSMVQDSAIVNKLGKIAKIPSVGRFNTGRLTDISPDSSFNPISLLNRFKSTYNVGLPDVLLENNVLTQKFNQDNQFVQTRGRHFMSRYAEFVPHPILSYPARLSPLPLSGGGAKLYKNPIRSFPYYTLNKGYKEFVLCVVAKGKHFGEPRVLISQMGGSRKFYWDKVPPKFDWQPSYDPKVAPYSPVFYMVESSGRVVTSSLEQNSIPFVFDVSLDTVVDRGSTIASIKLKFNYTADFLSLDPVTGLRQYRSQDVTVDVDRSYLNKRSSLLKDVMFPNIDARFWRAGVWDMWIETEDALGNKGIAPLNAAHGNDGLSVGVRTIKVNE